MRHKRHLFLFLFLFLFTFLHSFSQNPFEANYGVNITGNYTTVNLYHENNVGIGMGGLGAFYQRPISPYHASRYLNRLDYSIEPGVTWLGYRDQNSDKRYQANYFDFGLNLNYIPDRMSEDLRLFVGVRPSSVIYTNSSILEYGSWREISKDTQNMNRSGNIDLCGIIGVHVSLGNVAGLELKYVHSFTSQTTAAVFKGRPSSFEVGLKLSAIKLRDLVTRDEMVMVREMNKRSQGTLLVMLEEPDEKLIARLLQDQKVDDADLVRNLQKQTNLNIIKAFREQFDFCKVEFFMNSKANEVNRMDFSGVFLNDDLSAGKMISIDSSNYMLGAFVEDISDYTHKSDYGLYFYDPHFVQMGKPFNTGINGMGIFVGGDPMNYFRRVKTSGYSPDEFRKVVRRVNARLQLARIPKNQ